MNLMNIMNFIYEFPKIHHKIHEIKNFIFTMKFLKRKNEFHKFHEIYKIYFYNFLFCFSKISWL